MQGGIVKFATMADALRNAAQLQRPRLISAALILMAGSNN